MSYMFTQEFIRDLGFPIAVATSTLLFIFSMFKWLTGTNKKQYEDHRKDIHDLSEKFTTTVNKTVSAFELSVKGTEERQTQIIGHLTDLKKNTDLILTHVKKRK